MISLDNPQVFISYAHDDLEIVYKLYADLKSREVNVWFDKEELGPGRWKSQIEKQISKSRYFLFCISEAALRKTKDGSGFVDDELQRAYEIAMAQDDRQFTIVPVMLDDCGHGDTRLSSFQQFGLFENWRSGIDKLAGLLGGHIQRSRILVVDDHPLARQGMARFINQERDLVVCGGAGDGYEALQYVEDLNPDLVITDIVMKGMGGMEFVRAMTAKYPDVPVLMLSMHDEGLYAERALRAGARGYIMKQEDPEKIINVVRTMLRGDIYVSESATSKILTVLKDSKAKEEATPFDRLSDRELEIFKMIGEGYRTRHIASTLHLSAKTVESYKARLKQKLRLSNAAELARYAVEWVKQQSKTDT